MKTSAPRSGSSRFSQRDARPARGNSGKKTSREARSDNSGNPKSFERSDEARGGRFSKSKSHSGTFAKTPGRDFEKRDGFAGKPFDKDRKPRFSGGDKPFDKSSNSPFSKSSSYPKRRDASSYEGRGSSDKPRRGRFDERDNRAGENRTSDTRGSDRDFKRDSSSFSENPREKRFTRDESSAPRRSSRPFTRDESSSDRRSSRPFTRDESSSDRRSSRPFTRDESSSERRSSRPFTRDESSSERRSSRPFTRDESSSERRSSRPFTRDESSTERRSSRPFTKDESSSERRSSRPFTRDESSSERRSSSRGRFDDERGSAHRERPPSYREGSERRSSYRDQDDRSGSYRTERAPRAQYGKGRAVPYDSSIRLNKYIANAGVCSRREADELIANGAITVNGEIITQMGYKVQPSDVILYGDERLKNEKKVYILLNKPKDFITTAEDTHDRKIVTDLVRNACKERVFPVGRLDRNTTGLLLLTNDGELTKRLTHPRHGVRKIYHVHLDKPLTKADLEQVANGVKLDDDVFIKPDAIAYVEGAETKKEVGIEIHSGQNRVVRRIFEQLGYQITKLDRVAFAGLTKKDLPRGKWRFLSDKEISFLKML